MSATGGGARSRSRTIPGGISDFDLSPDGKRAVVVAEVGRTVGSKAETPPPIETERFLFKRDGDGYLDDRTQQLFIVDLASGKARQLTAGERDHWHPAWSPDGKSIAYTAKDRGETDRDAQLRHVRAARRWRHAAQDQHLDGRRRRSGLGLAALLVARFAPLVWLEGGEGKWIYYAHAATGDRRCRRPVRSRVPRASTAGSTIRSSRPTARSSR